jgi:hypothetical protein
MKKTAQPQKTYTLTVDMMGDGSYWDARFAFNAKDEKDAQSKVWGWARYHGMSQGEVSFREATENEATHMLHNEWVN